MATVIGGGVAGITAALELADRGYRVRLFESRPRLGGRAFTLPEKPGQLAIDNGPHVILGRYREFRKLIRRIGTEGLFDQAKSLTLGTVDERGQTAELRLGPGFAPLKFPLAILRHGALKPGERLRALLGLGAVLLGAGAKTDGEAWCRSRWQNGGPRRVIWDPMSRAIMNAELSEIAITELLRTLRMAFLGSGREAAIWIPKAPWSEIIGDAAERALVDAGVYVSCGTRIERLVGIDERDGRVSTIRFATGTPGHTGTGPYELVVLAAPWQQTARFLSLAAPERQELDATRLEPSAIVSVYFESDDDTGLPELDLVSLLGDDPFDFFCRRAGAPRGQFAVLSGGGRGLDGLSVAEIGERAREQLLAHYPGAEGIAEARLRVTKEARATFVCRPGGPTRPKPGPWRGLPLLRLCGDWTDTGLPATLESAALSARMALADLD
ncbi:MAG: FAD-dependent oxidoreductase [Planctomycetota bacterium]